MRVSVGLFLVVGLIAVGCKKKDPADDQGQVGVDNGPVLGDGQPQQAATPTTGVATPTKVILPVKQPAFGTIGTAGQPGASPVQPPAAVTQPPAATPVTPVNTGAAAVVATAPKTPAGPVTGRGVPPPPGGRPKPGTK